jgi:hypothetical protein
MRHRLPGHRRGLPGRLGQRLAGRQAGRERRRVRAAGAVGSGHTVPGNRYPQVPRPVEQVVHRLGPVTSGDERGPGSHGHQPLRQDGAVLGDQPGECLSLGQVGRDHGGQREQPADQHRDRVGKQQPAAGTRHHDRVDHEREVPSGQRVGDGRDERRREQHAGLGRVGSDVIEHRVDLVPRERRRDLVDGADPERVLRGQRHDRRHAVGPAAREGLQVRLDPGPATGIGGSDGENPGHLRAGHGGRRRIRRGAGRLHDGSSGRPSTGLEARACHRRGMRPAVRAA